VTFMKKVFLLLSVLIVLPLFTTVAFSGAHKPTALFLLDAEPSVRLYSMGNIYSSISAEDAFYNPSMLGWTVNSGVSLAQWPSTVEGAKYNFAGAILPGNKYGTLNISYLNYATPSESIEELDGTTRSLKLEEDQLISLGYGFKLTNSLFAGANLKYLSSALAADYKATAVLGDFGLTYNTLNDRHSFGFSIRNFGQSVTYFQTAESLPQELQFGYAIKTEPIAHQTMVTGVSMSRVLNSDTQVLSAGVEYMPGISFLSIRLGARLVDSDMQYNAGVGVNFSSLDVGVGYGGMLSSDGLKQDNSPVRFALSWFFGPNDTYSKGEAYYNRGMQDKAIALWDTVHPGDKYYAKAQEAIKLHMDPPVLMVSTHLKSKNDDGILTVGEEGKIVITIANKGKSKAINIKNELVPVAPEKTAKNLDIEKFSMYSRIDAIEPGHEATIEVPVKADEFAGNAAYAFTVKVKEGRGFDAQPVNFIINTKGASPIPVMARYTFREDNSGNSYGNGNGIIETGEEIELTGYIINAGEATAKGLIAEMVSADKNIEILPEQSKAAIGELKPGEYKKVVFAFGVKNVYDGSPTLPIQVNITEQRARYSKSQSLNLALGKFYQDPIEPVFQDIDATKAFAALPKLSGPIPGSRAIEIISSKTGQPPALEFETKMSPDDNKNGIFE
jgi:hypothetical protein